MSLDLELVLAGDRVAVSRLITAAETGGEAARRLLAALYPHTGRAHVVGITGSPGSGKSSLVAQLAGEFRRQDRRVGIVAVDPSSPFSGGALLGDRVRMQGLATDPGVFIRSMANRGSLGGLAEATADAVAVLDAAGYEIVLVETVGTGQAEVDIAEAAHTVIVVNVPGMGDDIQVAKAGILEIADILVVNKADWSNSERTVTELEMMLRMGGRANGWVPPVLKTVAIRGTGVKEVAEAVERHYQHLRESRGWEERQLRNARRRVLETALSRLRVRLLQQVGEGRLQSLVEEVAGRRMDPYSAAAALLDMAGLPAPPGRNEDT